VGRSIASRTREKVLHGQAEVVAYWISDPKLTMRQGLTPSLHVDIADWPSEKSAQLLLAEKLIEHARPTPRIVHRLS
jgi:hypothetical protein